MSAVPKNSFLPAFVATTGVKAESGPNGVLLASGTTYYIPFGGDASPFNAIHFQWDAAIILTSVEAELACNPDASPYSAAAGDYVKTNTVGAGNLLDASSGTVTALTLSAIAGGTAGGAMFHLANGARRGRLKVVVAGTGGMVKAFAHGKA